MTVITRAVTGVVVGGLIWINQPLAEFLVGLTLLIQIGIVVAGVVTFLLAIYLDKNSDRREFWALLMFMWIVFFCKETLLLISRCILYFVNSHYVFLCFGCSLCKHVRPVAL